MENNTRAANKIPDPLNCVCEYPLLVQQMIGITNNCNTQISEMYGATADVGEVQEPSVLHYPKQLTSNCNPLLYAIAKDQTLTTYILLSHTVCILHQF